MCWGIVILQECAFSIAHYQVGDFHIIMLPAAVVKRKVHRSQQDYLGQYQSITPLTRNITHDHFFKPHFFDDVLKPARKITTDFAYQHSENRSNFHPKLQFDVKKKKRNRDDLTVVVCKFSNIVQFVYFMRDFSTASVQKTEFTEVSTDGALSLANSC